MDVSCSPSPLTAGGVVVALLAVALATVENRGGAWRSGPVWVSGCSLSCWPRAQRIPGLWPLLAAVVVFGPSVLARPSSGEALWMRRGLIVLSGAVDMVANILFLLATRHGALSVSAVIVSLYPVVVVVLARFVLRKRLS
jgi:hypothetical protein